MRNKNGCNGNLKRSKFLTISCSVQVTRLWPRWMPICFYKSFWEALKEEIMNTLRHFRSHQLFERSFNATYVALIPKKIGVVALRDYRPISLISGVYDIISKVLIKRLKRMLHKLVNTHLMAFIINRRQMMDTAFIANE